MSDIAVLARSSAAALRSRDLIRNGSDEASELQQSPEFRAAQSLDEAADEIERLREALYHSDEGLNYLHLYDESKYKEQSGG